MKENTDYAGEWIFENDKLRKIFEFHSFLDAISFMKVASSSIENLNHHPEWTNIYNKLEVVLQTHDAGNKVTDKDYELARILDDLYQSFSVE